MNYRHIFHAGNRCDVVKHSVLTLVLKHFHAKEKGFALLDTHAGTGLYDLKDERALKTGEAAEGIKRFLTSEPLPMLKAFYEILYKLNPVWDKKNAEEFRVYPGSPLLAFHLLRPQDRLIACELHPEDAETLRLHSPADNRLQIHYRDGYEAMGAFLPPPEKRGIVLIDPPYEEGDEFAHVVKCVKEIYKRWATGTYIIWYPIKDRPAIWNFHEALSTASIPKILCAEFIYENETRRDQLNGSGMIIINPPWKLDEELKELFPLLHKAMQSPHNGTSIKWLSPE
jgi:23S rRNA (adenine2030-N6)-methyltransferase